LAGIIPTFRQWRLSFFEELSNLRLTPVHTGNEFHFMLRLFDAGRRMFSKVGLQRYNMFLQFTLRLRVVDLFQFLEAALLVQFKIIPQCVFASADDFRNLLMQQSVRFQTDGVHSPLDDRRKMIVALIVDLFHIFWAEVKLFGHAHILPNLLSLVSQKPQFMPALSIVGAGVAGRKTCCACQNHTSTEKRDTIRIFNLPALPISSRQ
jgi:hypothetical protein